jgi:hypothetical protein
MKIEQTQCYETSAINPLNAELNPICHLIALLGCETIVDVSGLRVKHRKPENNQKDYTRHSEHDESLKL